MYFAILTGFSTDLYLALILNDTALTIVGSNVRKCAPSETAPGDSTLPLQSSLRSCDPSLRSAALALASNPSVFVPFSLEAFGYVLDVFPVPISDTSYFFVAGTNKSVINQAVDASNARASAKLTTVRSQLIQAVLDSGAMTKAYMATLGVQNNKQLQAMQDTFMAEIQAIENSSRDALARSQQQSTENMNVLAVKQEASVEARKADYLRQMVAISGLTIGVVLASLLLVLLLSAFWTFRLTTSLTHIIGLMEDVADMRVEDLAVPQRSGVREVARIQAAFQVLVSRIAEYKSYIPAGVLEMGRGGECAADYELLPNHEASHGDRVRGTARSDSDTDSAGRRESRISRSTGRRPTKASSNCGARLPNWRTLRRNVAVLSVNVVGFVDVLRASNDGVSREVLDDYVACIHHTVAQHRGNIDCLLGDQVFVTFNAHIPCGDPAEAALAAGLELQSQLLSRLGDRLRFQIGASLGPVFASSVGYTKFKFMVTVGSPMKMASLLSHVPRLENGSITLDADLEARAKFTHRLLPLEVVHLPHMRTLAKTIITSQRIFLLVKNCHLEEDEWIYQVEQGASSSSDWNLTFDKMAVARSLEEQEGCLWEYILRYPQDAIALRLRDRLHLWCLGAGIPM
eukprot:EG_transcript_3367